MSRPLKNKTRGNGIAKVAAGSATAKVGKPKAVNGRANTAAGGYAAGGKSKPMFEGPAMVLEDNRG
jgi:hypothetical protein